MEQEPRVLTLLPNEAELVRRAATDAAAFTLVYEQYFPWVYNYVRNRVIDPDLTDELVSQIFERLVRKLSVYRPERGILRLAHGLQQEPRLIGSC